MNLSDVSANEETAADSSIVGNESFESVDDPLNAHRAAGYATTFNTENPRISEACMLNSPISHWCHPYFRQVNRPKNIVQYHQHLF